MLKFLANSKLGEHLASYRSIFPFYLKPVNIFPEYLLFAFFYRPKYLSSTKNPAFWKIDEI